MSVDPRFLPLPPKPAVPIAYRSLDGLDLRANLWRRPRPSAKVTVVSPGYAQHHGNRIHQRVAALLLESGRDMLGADYRGMRGQPGRYSFGADEQLDLIPLLDWACQRYVDVELVGFSMGAYIGLRALAEHPAKVKRFYFVSGPTSIEDIVLSGAPIWQTINLLAHPAQLLLRRGAQSQPWFPYAWPLKPKPNGRALARQLTVPTAFLVGGHDWLVLPRLTRAVHDACAAPRTWTEIPDGQHAEYMAVLQSPAFLDWMAAFRRRPGR